MMLKYLNKYITRNVIMGSIPFLLLGLTLYYFYVYEPKENFSSSSKEVTLFYLPGCIHCKDLKPVWEKVANEFKGNVYITVSEVNGSTDDDLTNKYNVKGFPTIIYTENGKLMKTYEGNRSYESLKRFFEESIKY